MKHIGVAMIMAGMMVSGIHAIAHAYVPPAPFIIELMLKHLNMPSKLSVHQKLLIPREPDAPPEKGAPDENAASDEPFRSFDQHVRYRLPESFRSDIQHDQFSRIHVYNAEKAVTVVDGTVVSNGSDWGGHFKDLFMYRSRKRLTAHLADLGVDVKTASLGRLDKTLVYVIGADYPDETSPQLWIEKDFFRPVRWILTPALQPNQPPRHEILYSDWRRVNKAWYPGRVVFLESGRQTHEMTTLSIDANPVFPTDLFDPEKVRNVHESPEPASGGGAPENDIRRQIEQFKQLYE